MKSGWFAALVSIWSIHASAQEPLPTANPPVATAPGLVPLTASDKARRLVEFGSLSALLDRNLITKEEYNAALKDLGDSGTGPSSGFTMLVGKFATTLYGFVEADAIYDTTQALTEGSGNASIPLNSSYAGSHSRFTFSIRDSRIGIRLRAPKWHGITAVGTIEADFLGNQPSSPPATTESAYFGNPTFRVRHAFLRLDNPVLTVLVGQYWSLFGWGSVYQPNTPELPGIVGESYSRTAQLRVSHTFESSAVNFEIAVAMMRNPQRDAGTPEGQAGLRLFINGWKGIQTNHLAINQTNPSGVQPASLAVSGTIRNFGVNNLSGAPTVERDILGWGVAGDVFLPLIPTRDMRLGNALSLTGEFSYGTGIGDLYSGLGSAGIASQAQPLTDPVTMMPVTYSPNFDNNATVAYDANGKLNTVNLMAGYASLQYYLPGAASRVHLSATYGHMESDNAKTFGTTKQQAKILAAEDFANGALWADVTDAVRFGLGYSYYRYKYSDAASTVAENHRVMLTSYYLF